MDHLKLEGDVFHEWINSDVKLDLNTERLQMHPSAAQLSSRRLSTFIKRSSPRKSNSNSTPPKLQIHIGMLGTVFLTLPLPPRRKERPKRNGDAHSGNSGVQAICLFLTLSNVRNVSFKSSTSSSGRPWVASCSEIGIFSVGYEVRVRWWKTTPGQQEVNRRL